NSSSTDSASRRALARASTVTGSGSFAPRTTKMAKIIVPTSVSSATSSAQRTDVVMGDCSAGSATAFDLGCRTCTIGVSAATTAGFAATATTNENLPVVA